MHGNMFVLFAFKQTYSANTIYQRFKNRQNSHNYQIFVLYMYMEQERQSIDKLFR